MNNKLSFLIIVLLFCILVVPSMAAMNINETATGTTWITWEIEPGQDITDIYVDGYQMCGYETTSPTFDIVGLSSCAEHTVVVFTAFDNGTDTASTLCGNATIITGSPEDISPVFFALGLSVGIILFIGRKRLFGGRKE
jgi:hypothetical protein